MTAKTKRHTRLDRVHAGRDGPRDGAQAKR